MDRGLRVPALVLLDEVGSGTDPIEGGALGVAIVDHFRRRGATVIATSHYDALKTYASTTDGVATRGVRLRRRDVRADLPAAVRIAGPEPGARDRRAPRAEPVDRRRGAPEPERARGAARRAPREDRPATCARSSTSSGSRRASARRSRRPRRGCASAKRRCGSARRRSARRLTEELDAQVRQARREIDEVIAGPEGEDASASRRTRRAHVVTHRRHRRGARRGARGRRRRRRARARARTGRGRDPRRAESRTRRPVGDRVVVGGLGLEGVVTVDPRRHGRARRARQADARQPCAICGSSARRGRGAAQVNVHVELQPRDGDADRAERHRLHRGRSARARRAVSRRVAADRSAHGPVHSRLRHRSAEARARRVPAAAPARRATFGARRRPSRAAAG